VILPLLALAASAAEPAPVARHTVLVAIVREAASATLVPEGTVAVAGPGLKTRVLEWKGHVPLTPRVGGLKLADMKIPSETRLAPAAGSAIKVGSHRYRGALILRLDPGQTLTIVEELGMEQYLEGVLPHEMDPDWPLEALKAQAVVARTFAYANMGKFRKDGFDLTSDTRSQVYRGLTAVNENVRAAVRQTRGEVLGWNGKLLRVYYHACCGGATTDPGSAWGSDDAPPRPLRGVRDPWCRLSPHMKWTAYFPWPDLTAALSERRVLPGALTALKTGARDAAGFLTSVVAKTKGGSVAVAARELRTALGATELRSTRIRAVSNLKKGVEFSGAGSGHGVGLCQWGARLQADKGRNYDQILSFYFPGSTLSEIDE
jgi:stage II sporulation protein D